MQTDIDVAEPFGTWLLTQIGLSGWIGELAKAAKADAKFPRDGDADAVRAHLNKNEADGEMFEAIDDAERRWLRR